MRRRPFPLWVLPPWRGAVPLTLRAGSSLPVGRQGQYTSDGWVASDLLRGGSNLRGKDDALVVVGAVEGSDPSTRVPMEPLPVLCKLSGLCLLGGRCGPTVLVLRRPTPLWVLPLRRGAVPLSPRAGSSLPSGHQGQYTSVGWGTSDLLRISSTLRGKDDVLVVVGAVEGSNPSTRMPMEPLPVVCRLSGVCLLGCG